MDNEEGKLNQINAVTKLQTKLDQDQVAKERFREETHTKGRCNEDTKGQR